MARNDLTAQRLRELLDYDPATGRFVCRINRRIARAGSDPCKLRADGYLSTTIDYKRYQAHNLAWLHVHGKWPDQVLDHINGNRSDNRIENLRDVSETENQLNRTRLNRNNTSGVRGVDFKDNFWRLRVYIFGKKKTIGRFETLAEARIASAAAYLVLVGMTAGPEKSAPGKGS